jgi:hypothetical protein
MSQTPLYLGGEDCAKQAIGFGLMPATTVLVHRVRLAGAARGGYYRCSLFVIQGPKFHTLN